jgi:pantoate--beta-alanine ligase
MLVVATIDETRATLDAARARGERIGFVPTMGALHDGHCSLMKEAAAECDFVAVSLFVNPLQFGANDDLARYPRPFGHDRDMAEAAGVRLLFAPSIEEMYPTVVTTSVHVDGSLGEVLEAAHRPGHLDGVATVVAKLFNIAGPSNMYFGEKDWQQLCVVRRLAADLSFPVHVIGVPTVREADGVALSSRNAYLSPVERAAAPALYRALEAGRHAIEAGERDPVDVEALMRARLHDFAVDYTAVVDAQTLTRVAPLSGSVRLLLAARIGTTRLIDNLGIELP